jgi:hypothetical protein
MAELHVDRYNSLIRWTDTSQVQIIKLYLP